MQRAGNEGKSTFTRGVETPCRRYPSQLACMQYSSQSWLVKRVGAPQWDNVLCDSLGSAEGSARELGRGPEAPRLYRRWVLFNPGRRLTRPTHSRRLAWGSAKAGPYIWRPARNGTDRKYLIGVDQRVQVALLENWFYSCASRGHSLCYIKPPLNPISIPCITSTSQMRHVRGVRPLNIAKLLSHASSVTQTAKGVPML